jgi:hypothetical protein
MRYGSDDIIIQGVEYFRITRFLDFFHCPFCNSQKRYDVTYSSWVSIRFRSRVFRFDSIGGASDRYYRFSQIVFYFNNQTMEKVQKPSNSECDTPSSEPFRIY